MARKTWSTPTPWQAGYAACDITPARGLPMSGYARERYAQGTIAPLIAQALALRAADGTTALLLTADVLGFERPTVALLRARLQARHGLPPTHLILAASHTHWGPAIHVRVNYLGSGPNLNYLHQLEEQLLRLAGEALTTLRPAQVGYTSLEAQIGHNRRLPAAAGTIDWGVNTAGAYDTHTPVLRVTCATGAAPRDILVVSHACHPTSTGFTPRWSPDYPGALRARLQEALGGTARAMFVMGCGADAKVTHHNKSTGQREFSASPAQSRAAGRRLAQAVLTHLASHEAAPLPGTLACHAAAGQFTLAPPRSPAAIAQLWLDEKATLLDRTWARQLLLAPDARRRYDYEITAWNLGGTVTLFGLPDEVCSPLGPRTRALATTPHAMIAAYANGVNCYIPAAAIVREGGYEGESSHRAYLLAAPFTSRIDHEFDALARRAVAGLAAA